MLRSIPRQAHPGQRHIITTSCPTPRLWSQVPTSTHPVVTSSSGCDSLQEVSCEGQGSSAKQSSQGWGTLVWTSGSTDYSLLPKMSVWNGMSCQKEFLKSGLGLSGWARGFGLFNAQLLIQRRG